MTIDCQWNHPGADPYTITPKSAAVAYYKEIPNATRDKLRAKLDSNRFDYVVDITRDAISGGFDPDIRRMHFGKGRVCETVDRSGWTTYEVQPAFVYCEDGYCLIEPFICHNISMVYKTPEKPMAALPPAAPVIEESAIDAPLDDLTPAPPVAFDSQLVPVFDGYGGWVPVGMVYGPTLPRPGGSLPPVTPVPEPSTYLLMLGGLFGLMGLRKLQRK